MPSTILRDFDEIYYIDLEDADDDIKALFEVEDPISFVEELSAFNDSDERDKVRPIPLEGLISFIELDESISPNVAGVRALNKKRDDDVRIFSEFFGSEFKISELIKPMVKTLRAINRTPYYIYVPFGTSVIGGLQNRLIAEDYVVPPKTITPIDVFCIEHGRFSGKAMFDDKSVVLPSIRFLSLGKMFLKSVYGTENGDMTQGNIWKYIGYLQALLGFFSKTSDFNSILERFSYSDGFGNLESINGIFYSDVLNKFFLDVFGGVRLPLEYKQDMVKNYIFEEHLLGLRRDKSEGGRIYFRVFDSTKKLAIQVLHDGSPVKDMSGNYVVFKYKDKYLKNKIRIKDAKALKRVLMEQRNRFRYTPRKENSSSISLNDIKKIPVVLYRLGSDKQITKKFFIRGYDSPVMGSMTIYNGNVLRLFIGGIYQ